jgi:DNA-binding beta-propeller fold protein YncE
MKEHAMKRIFSDVGATALTIMAATALLATAALAQTAPRFAVDASWPKPLPEGWIPGQLGGICVDGHDHIIVVNRRDITDEEKETGKQAPPVMVFDSAGNLVDSWGDPAVVPRTIHGCVADKDNNIYVAGNGDGIVQKYSHEGKLLLQIGTRGKYDTADGAGKGPGLNTSFTQFYHPAGLAIDPGNGDMYVADGYGNRRVAVFDRDGKFLRQWGRQATKEEAEQGVAGAFSQVIHCVTMSRAGLIYVCDRQGDRVQVFDKQGAFIRNIWIRTGTTTLPDPRGTAWWVDFSPDPEQKLMYMMNGRNEQVHILDHASGKILSSFGRPGHQAGEFTHGHTLAVDSKGNIYVAETNWGRRVQKFKLAE